MNSAMLSVLAQGGGYDPRPDGPLIALGVIVGLAFAIYLAQLALTLRRERSGRPNGPGRNS